MKLHKVQGSIIGVTQGKVSHFVSPDLADMSAPARKAWLLGGEGAARGAFTVTCLFEESDDAPRVLRFAHPLTFEWVAVSVAGAKGGKRRALAVKQADLGITTVADPASLLSDLAFEVAAAHSLAHTKAHAMSPATAEQAAKVRALVQIGALADAV